MRLLTIFLIFASHDCIILTIFKNLTTFRCADPRQIKYFLSVYLEIH